MILECEHENGLAVGGILLAFVPSTSVIAFSALACILVGLGGLVSPTFRSMALPSTNADLVKM